MTSTNCPACGTPNACSVGRAAIECVNTRCKFYSAKWAAIVTPGGEAFYVPPQIGGGRFAAIAGDLNQKPAPDPEAEALLGPLPPNPPSTPPVLAPQLRRVVTSKKMRSILFENPGTPRMLWVSREIETYTPYGQQSYDDISPMFPGVWDLVAFSGTDLEFLTVDRFETRIPEGAGTSEILAYDQPLQFFSEPSACMTPVVQKYRGEQTVYLSLKINAPEGSKPRFRAMFWGRPIDRSLDSNDLLDRRSGRVRARNGPDWLR